MEREADFIADFDRSLRSAGQELQDNGYNVTGYKAFVETVNGRKFWNFSEKDPIDALDQSLQELKHQEHVGLSVSGEELSKAVKDCSNIEDLLYRNVCGGIDIEEPTADVEYADDVEAFGTIIHYIPGSSDGYFEFGTAETKPPYTREDAIEYVEDIVEVLDSSGFETRQSYIE